MSDVFSSVANLEVAAELGLSGGQDFSEYICEYSEWYGFPWTQRASIALPRMIRTVESSAYEVHEDGRGLEDVPTGSPQSLRPKSAVSRRRDGVEVGIEEPMPGV